jgi:hypothetical protein
VRGIRIEKEVEIYATNLANKTKCMRTNAKKWGEKTHFLLCFLVPSILILIYEDIIPFIACFLCSYFPVSLPFFLLQPLSTTS